MLSIACLAGFIAVSFFLQPTNTVGFDDSSRTITEQIRLYPTRQNEEPKEQEEIEDDITDDEVKEEREMIDETFGNVILYIAYAVAAIVIMLLSYFLMRNLRGRGPGPQLEDYVEDLTVEPVEAGLRKKKKAKLFDFSANQTIRRLFRQKVQEFMHNNALFPLKKDTPAKLADTIKQWEEVDELRDLYHKARYSGEDVKRSELNEYYAKRNG